MKAQFRLYNPIAKQYLERMFESWVEACNYIDVHFELGLCDLKTKRRMHIHRYINDGFDAIACK